jgi:hypothetical protein
MKARTKKLAALAALLVVLAVAVTVALVTHRTAPVTPSDFVPTTWEAARTAPMHAAHVGREKIACTECHTSGFEAKPSEASCTKCHAGAAAHAHRGAERAPTPCLTCHVFGAGKQAATCVECHGPTAKDQPATSDAARATHELARHVTNEAACTACHDVHGEPGKTRVVLPDCTACHATTTVAHGRVAAGPHGAPDAGETFDAAVSRYALDARAAAGLREAGATLAGGTCTSCHAPHAAAASAREACASCHVGGHEEHASTEDAKTERLLVAELAPRIEPRGRGVAGHQACITCHAPHSARKADAREACATCHADHRGAMGVSGHAACTGCHAPHAPAEAGSSCASSACHAGKVALAAPRVAAHAACESCHDPHRPTESPALACARCHGEVQPKHPAFASKTASASACVGCHAPHPAAAALAKSAGGAPTSAACSSCHTKARGDRALHAGGVACAACHVPHDFGSTFVRAAGAKAHGSAAAPGTKLAAAALCATCHAPKAAAVASRPGHADCESCHGPAHTPSKKPACATCHAQETASAPRGHAVCTQCHEAHSGSLGTHVSCTSCHAEKAKAQHASLPNGCASCHRPHGPKGLAAPPTCASCHASSKLDGLHGVAAHAASCASCHASHAPPRSDRTTCTSACHVDRRNHQPEAKVCNGCHMFRK